MKIDMADLGFTELHATFASIIAPRPIALVATVGKDGIYNLAPYGLYTGVSTKPALIGFQIGWRSDGTKKDTLINIEATKEFVISVVNETLAEPMNITSDQFPLGVDEFKEAGLTAAKADMVRAPLVAEAPINVECRFHQCLEFGDVPHKSSFIIAEVLLVHVKDEVYTAGKIDMAKVKVIGRLGSTGLYCRTEDTFTMKRPGVFD